MVILKQSGLPCPRIGGMGAASAKFRTEPLREQIR